MVISMLQHQVRTSDRIYHFQSKDQKTISLKVYDVARSFLAKSSIELDSSKIQVLFSEPKAETLLSLFPEQKISPAPL